MSRTRGNDTFIWGIILVVIGVIFLLNNLDINAWRIVANLWPLVLIVWGVRKLYLGLKERQQHQWPAPNDTPNAAPNENGGEEEEEE
ncbi:MAG TPA: hypothetical protein ENF17_07460 [Candidatus Aminicenantes bacterium]|nr:hypothetical protein [Candidatus Aminicenantes bacterium]